MKKDYQNLIRAIRSGDVDPVYFLNGDDFFLQDMFIEEVQSALSKITPPEKVVFVPEAGDYDGIVSQLFSVSLFPQPRLFVLRNPTRIQGRNRRDLLEYCKSPNRDNCLIIVIDKYDPRHKLVTALANLVGTIVTAPPFPQKMPEWARFLIRKCELSFSEEAVEKLVELSGDSLYHLANEVEKIKIGLAGRRRVEEEDVLAHSGWGRNFGRWDFLDAIGERDFRQATFVGKNLLDQGMELSMLISLMTTFFQVLLFRLLGEGEGEKWNGGGKSWLGGKVKQKLPKYEKFYGVEQVTKIFRFLAAADRKVKSSPTVSESILIPLIYTICQDHAR